jgi:hypothetical protein
MKTIEKMTLAVTLGMIATLEATVKSVEKELKSVIGRKAFRGKAIMDMADNYLLYNIALANVMQTRFKDLLPELDNGFAEGCIDPGIIEEMEGLFIERKKLYTLRGKINALEDYVSEAFDKSDHKRIRKAASIKKLAKLGIIDAEIA